MTPAPPPYGIRDLVNDYASGGIKKHLRMTPAPCILTGMAQRHTQKKAGGRVVTPAPNSAKGKSTTTAKKAGVQARKPTLAQARKRHADTVATMRELARKASVKPVYICPTLDDALAKADTMKDSLTTAGIHAGGRVSASRESAQARREWCENVGAPLVNIADILHANKAGESLTDRSENVLRMRVRVRAEKTHGDPARYYVVRATPFVKGEQSLAYIVRL